MNPADYTIKAIFFFPPDIITLPFDEWAFYFHVKRRPSGRAREVLAAERRDLLRPPATIGVEEQKQRGAPLDGEEAACEWESTCWNLLVMSSHLLTSARARSLSRREHLNQRSPR